LGEARHTAVRAARSAHRLGLYLRRHLSAGRQGALGTVGSTKLTFPANKLGWAKWKPSDPTSAHWYDVPRFVRLIAANIAHAQDRKQPCKTVRNFVAEFRGLREVRSVTRSAYRAWAWTNSMAMAPIRAARASCLPRCSAIAIRSNQRRSA
jgi:hypothetical protein